MSIRICFGFRDSDFGFVGLFRIPYRTRAGAKPVLVCILLEHQSRPEARMPLRVLLYGALYWEGEWKDWESAHDPGVPLQLSPIIPIVFHTGPGRWTTNRDLADLIEAPDELRRLAPRWPILFWDLAERSPRQLLDDAGGWLQALAVVRAEQEETEAFLEVFREALTRLEAIGAEDRIRWHDLMWFVLSWAFRRRPSDEKKRLEETARKSHHDRTRRKEVREMTKTIKKSWEAELLERGAEVGRQEGALRARREVLKELLQDRFGNVPESVLRRIDATDDLDRLKAAVPKVSRIESPDELEL